MEIQKYLKAAIYIRVSTEEQAEDGQSASAQAETLKQYCSAYKIEVFDIYMDLGLSGKKLADRKELSRLVEDCVAGQFDLVLVWKISRLSRNLKDLLYLIDVFEKHNVHFASCSEKFDTSTPVGRMTLQLLGSIAEFERNTIVENVKLGLREFARKGGKASSVFGYDNADKKLTVNEHEAGIVKLIFSLYTEAAMSCTAIAGYLNSLGYRTKRGSEFRCSNISYIIHNPVYIGLNRHSMNTENEYSVQGMHPSIIDAGIWNKAQNRGKEMKRIPASADYDTDPLHFPVICMRCGSLMRVFYACSRGKKYKYMRCCSCSNYVNAVKLIEAVRDAILKLLDDNSVLAKAYSLVEQVPDGIRPDAALIASIEAEINTLKKSKSRYLSLFEGYKISDTKVFLDRVEEIELRMKMLEKKKAEAVKAALTANAPVNYEEYFCRLKERLSAQERAVLPRLYCLVRYIEAFRDEISVVLYL
ncbi:MAG TPA: recombinase family protein [Clostridia bacterium]|nr:recombinase family protein [Clostridia bacterium]